MPTHTVESLDSPTGRTRLTVDLQSSAVTVLEAVNAAGTSRYAAPMGSTGLFLVRIVRFDMEQPAQNASGNGAVVYRSDGSTGHQVLEATPALLRIRYTGMPALVNAPDGGQAGFPAAFPPLDVTVTVQRSADAGWIEVGASFTLPAAFATPHPRWAWETQVAPLRVSVSNAAASAKKHQLLLPEGSLVPFPLLDDRAQHEQSMPLQFAALFETGVETVPYARGFALSATDELGFSKVLGWKGNGTVTNLGILLHTPIHLKGGEYVRAPAFAIPGGDAGGWGGAPVRPRIRAFRIDAAAANQPVEWTDVADLYRDWVRTRTSTLFRKATPGRTPTGPVDNMSPFTYVSNYAIDGAVGSAANAEVGGMLEMHPAVVPGTAATDPASKADITGNKNEPMHAVLKRVRDEFRRPDVRLEAQFWGFEMGGYFRFLGGLPPQSDVISGRPWKFRDALNWMTANGGIVPSITTDPLLPNFDRTRFRGHLLPPAFTDAIPYPFPAAIKTRLAGKVSTGPDGRTFTLLAGYPAYDRLFGTPPYVPQLRVASNGAVVHKLGLRATLLYQIHQYGVCPTPTTSDIFNREWLKDEVGGPGGILDHGARNVEFMKHHHAGSFCWDRRHAHLPAATASYDGVMGTGPWFTTRLSQMLAEARRRGQAVYPGFTLTNEFVPHETMVPHFDEAYVDAAGSAGMYGGDTTALAPGQEPASRSVPLFQYVYSQVMTTKMNVLAEDSLPHPGYREPLVPRPPENPAIGPAFMLHGDRDTRATLAPAWLSAAQKYYDAHYKAATNHGLAPNGYVTDDGHTYTYSRCVQDVANLRSRIFRLGYAAVIGERILLPTSWMDQPREYNDGPIRMAVLATQMQMQFSTFFRRGWMLGRAALEAGPPVRTWRVPQREFADVPVVREKVGLESFDAISRATDLPGVAKELVADRVQHMVWQKKNSAGKLEAAYLYANISNSPATVEVRWTRGVAGHGIGSLRVFAGEPNGVEVQRISMLPKAAFTFTMAPRTLAVIHYVPD